MKTHPLLDAYMAAVAKLDTASPAIITYDVYLAEEARTREALVAALSHTPATAAEPVASELRPRFAIGQPVEVPDTCQYWADWRGQTLWIAGVQFDHRRRRLDYTVSEHWPPRHNGDLSDGWAEGDLTGARPSAMLGGEE